jgi:hypothetical protein
MTRDVRLIGQWTRPDVCLITFLLEENINSYFQPKNINNSFFLKINTYITTSSKIKSDINAKFSHRAV